MSQIPKSSASADLHTVPFTRVTLTGKEMPYIEATLKSLHFQGDGPMAKQCEIILEKLTGAPRVLLTSSGTDALEMATLLAGIGPGDEVIMPSFTFPSTANAVVLRYATPVFVDIRSDTLNLDETKIAAAITPKTRAILPVHYAGFGCNMTSVMDIARAHKLLVIEDAAHGPGAYWQGKHLGTFGSLGMLSFHQTKNVVAGEGGALLINDPELIDRAEILREKGTNRRRFLRGEVDKYTWVDVGSSYLPAELSAAMLLAQLEHIGPLNAARVKAFDRYVKAFTPLAKRECFAMPHVPTESIGNGHKFFLITKSSEERSQLRDFLRSKKIQAVSHFEPLHSAPAAAKYARTSGNLDMTEELAAKVLRLPLYADLPEADQDRVITAVADFYATR